jgi:cytochrome c oxidase subunit 3
MIAPEDPTSESEKGATAGLPGSTGREPNLAQQFSSPEQQFAAGRLGMWIFLVTEILLFGGMFCAYAVFRANHPEIFFYAEQFLDRTLGAINTAILITSSLTMALAVHCAQRDRRRALIVCLALTLTLACSFLGIKYVEYKHKWEAGLLWAGAYRPEIFSGESRQPQEPSAKPLPEARQEAKKHAGVFFSVYFMMTGLHALHVVAGMAVITWILVLATKGRFGSRYFAPVDNVGLYWHLVDMIWIYLFPLLYLIH